MRRAALALLALLLVGVLAPAAGATKPAREVLPAPGDMVFTDQCDFPVLGHIEGGEINTTFFDRAGEPVKLLGAFPGQTLTLTNLDNTDEAITVSDAGSFQLRAKRDGSLVVSITGHGPLPNEFVGEPGLWYLDGGHILVTLDAEGNPSSITVRGNVVNLCEQLAPAS